MKKKKNETIKIKQRNKHKNNINEQTNEKQMSY